MKIIELYCKALDDSLIHEQSMLIWVLKKKLKYFLKFKKKSVKIKF